ncbi:MULTISPECIES: hypothetical protein [Streptomyces]|uniref:hypothetical protein n=1 Tax=Streptomyces TaxID=1883 RepID=UPI0015FFA5BE|nr:hypothetical protein [Streptomyces murinus]MBA9049305.1 hypothetical protein [Streptomyces murinus]
MTAAVLTAAPAPDRSGAPWAAGAASTTAASTTAAAATGPLGILLPCPAPPVEP